jgi:hypothetical protein
LTTIEKIGWVIIHSDTLQSTIFSSTNTLQYRLEEPGIYTLIAEMYGKGSIVPIASTSPVQVAVIDQNKPPVASLYTDMQDSSVYIGSYAVDPESALVGMAWYFDGAKEPDTVISVDTAVECGFGFNRVFEPGKHFILLKVMDEKGVTGHATTSIVVE